jgi:probable HAF family extracellular repeat protein
MHEHDDFRLLHEFYKTARHKLDDGPWDYLRGAAETETTFRRNRAALDINNSDRLAGYSSTTNGFEHAFRYANGVMTDLGTLGGNYSYGIGINNSNAVVGGAFVDSGNKIYHAFIAVNNSMVDLNTQLDATGAGWTLTEARAINDAGQIVGTGIFDGVNRAFLLNPLPAAPLPTITGVRVSAGDILVSFTTIADVTYAVEARTLLTTGNWGPLIGSIPGTGAVITITNAGAASLPQQFYRVRAVVP